MLWCRVASTQAVATTDEDNQTNIWQADDAGTSSRVSVSCSATCCNMAPMRHAAEAAFAAYAELLNASFQ